MQLLFMQLLFMQLIVRFYMIAKNPAKTPSQKPPKNPPKIHGKNLLGFVGSSRALTKH
jgi:hypothetical protein